jgi:hypothetical protein
MTMTVQRYIEIKEALDAAKELESAARQELVARSGHTAKGSKTVKMDGFKVSITNSVNITIYEPGLEEAKQKLGERFQVAFRTKFEPNAKGWKELNPTELEIAEEAIITKPGTPQLSVKGEA